MATNSYTNTAVLNSPDNVNQAIQSANLTFYPTDEDSLPYDSPHVQEPLAYAAPPLTGSSANILTRGNFTPTATVTLGLSVPGTQITLGVFPQAQRIATVLFANNAGLLSVDLAVAFSNSAVAPFTQDGQYGIFAAKDVGPTIGLGSSSDIYDGILAPVGNFSKRSGASFSLDIAPLIAYNTSVALYAVAYGTNLATAILTTSAIFRYVNLDG